MTTRSTPLTIEYASLETEPSTDVDWKKAFESLTWCMRNMRDEYRKQADEKWAAFMEYRQSSDLNDHFRYSEGLSAMNVALGLANDFANKK